MANYQRHKLGLNWAKLRSYWNWGLLNLRLVALNHNRFKTNSYRPNWPSRSPLCNITSRDLCGYWHVQLVRIQATKTPTHFPLLPLICPLPPQAPQASPTTQKVSARPSPASYQPYNSLFPAVSLLSRVGGGVWGW